MFYKYLKLITEWVNLEFSNEFLHLYTIFTLKNISKLHNYLIENKILLFINNNLKCNNYLCNHNTFYLL